MLVLDLFKRFKKGIILAISLVVIENVAWVIEPSLFGKVIDSLNDFRVGNIQTVNILIVGAWIGIFLLNSGVGALRRSLDQKIYLNMFTEIATDVAKSGVSKRQSVSTTAARAELSREFISFFQYRLPEILDQTISIVGAIIALIFFDIRIALACFAIILPLMLITRLYNNKVINFQKEFHDSREEAFEVFSTRDPQKVHEYYSAMAKPQQKIANWGAVNFGVMRLCLLIIFLIVLYISLDLDNFSTGNIYSIVAYLWTFVTSSEYLPELLESWTSLKDISRRLRTEKV
jgi:ABC-type multidrug transport system fused ATPase/permease subunit